MPIGYNHVALVGRIVETPLYKNFGDNKMMIFSIAVPDPEELDKIDFIPCIAFNLTAEFIYNRIDPDDLVLIDGKIKQYKFAYLNGNTKEELRVKVNNIYLLEAKILKDRQEIMNKYELSTSDRKFAEELDKIAERLSIRPDEWWFNKKLIIL